MQCFRVVYYDGISSESFLSMIPTSESERNVKLKVFNFDFQFCFLHFIRPLLVCFENSQLSISARWQFVIILALCNKLCGNSIIKNAV